MANEIPIKLVVEDDGSVTIERFVDNVEEGMRDAAQATESSTRKMGSAWRGVTSVMGRVAQGARGVVSSIFSVRGAVTGLIAALGVKKLGGSLLRVGIQTENFETRLRSLLGSQAAATAAMDKFNDVARRVPFTLEDTIEAGIRLQAFLGGTEYRATELTDTVADLAAFMGVSMPEAASAWGRAMAAGAGAADTFRERGVLALVQAEAGIEDMSKITLPEFREAMIRVFRDAEGPISGSADRLSKTFSGLLSMIGDSWFRFQQRVLERGVFDSLKRALDGFNEFLKSPVFQEIADTVGDKLNKGFSWLIDHLPDAVKVMERVAKGGVFMVNTVRLIAAAVDLVIKAFNNLGPLLDRAFLEAQAAVIRGMRSIFDAVGEVLRQLGAHLAEQRGGFVRGIGVMFTELSNAVNTFEVDTSRALNSVNEQLRKNEEGIAPVRTAWQEFLDGFARFETADAQVSNFFTKIDAGARMIRLFVKNAMGAQQEAAEATVDTVKTVTDTVKEMTDKQVDELVRGSAAYSTFAGAVSGALAGILVGERQFAKEFPRLVKQAVFDALKTMAQQEIVEGMIALAKGTVALVTAPSKAALFFKGAGLHFAAAAAAGVAAQAVAPGGGGGGGGGGAPTRERETPAGPGVPGTPEGIAPTVRPSMVVNVQGPVFHPEEFARSMEGVFREFMGDGGDFGLVISNTAGT